MPPRFLRITAALLLATTCLSAKPSDHDNPDDNLVSAARKGDIPAMKAALAAGAKVTYKNKFGETALMNAADDEQYIAVQFLLEHGADPTITNSVGRTALTFALMSYGTMSALELIGAYKDPKLLQAPEVTGDKYLNIASRLNLRKPTEALVARGVPPDSGDDAGRTPLSIFSEYGDTEVVETLLKYKADPNLKDHEGKTPYMWASEAGAGGVLELLKAAGATPREMPLKPKNWAITQNLTDAEKWSLAPAAMNILRNRWSCELLGGKPEGIDKQSSQKMLTNGYNIYTREDAIQILDQLKAAKDHTELLAKLRAVHSHSKSVPSDDAAAIRSEEARHPASNRGKFLAWDLCRLILVADASYGRGYLSDKESWNYILPAARKLQKAYSSWKDLSDDYLLARAVKYGEAQDDLTYMQTRLLDPAQKTSPWQLSWNTALGVGGWTR